VVGKPWHPCRRLDRGPPSEPELHPKDGQRNQLGDHFRSIPQRGVEVPRCAQIRVAFLVLTTIGAAQASRKQHFLKVKFSQEVGGRGAQPKRGNVALPYQVLASGEVAHQGVEIRAVGVEISADSLRRWRYWAANFR